METQVVDESLDYLSHLAPHELHQEMQRLLPLLITSLQDSKQHPTRAVKSADALFKQFLPTLSEIREAEEQIFTRGLPAVKDIFTELLQALREKFRESCDSTTAEILGNLFQVSLTLLESVESCLEFLATKQQIRAAQIESFFPNFGSILMSTQDICCETQNYCELYGPSIGDLSSIIGEVFKKSVSNFETFTKLFKDNILFDSENELEMFLLRGVVDNLVDMIGGLQCTSLGARYLSEAWKFYAALTSSHAANLTGRIDVSKPMEFLVHHITTEFAVDAQMNEKIQERNLKLSSFLLRVLIKLCSQFPEAVEESSPRLSLLTRHLLSMSDIGRVLQSEPPVTKFQQLLGVGVAPLLVQLVSSRRFAAETLQPNPMSVRLVLLCQVAQQLPSVPPDNRAHWFTNSTNILSAIVLSLRDYDQQFTTDSCSQQLYDLVLTSVVPLLTCLSCEEFLHLEKALWRVLSEPDNLWQAVVVCDLWVAMVRAGGATMCKTQVETLRPLMLSSPPGLQAAVLHHLVARLQTLLPGKPKEETRPIPTPDQITRYRHTLQQFIDTPPSLSTFQILLQTLTRLSHLEPTTTKPLLPLLFDVWLFIEDSKAGKHLAVNLLNVFLPSIPHLSNAQISTLLQGLTQVSDPYLKAQNIHLLTSLSSVKLTSDSHQGVTLNHIASSYCSLLQDEDQLIQRAALESFASFASVTSHVEVVRLTGSQSPVVMERISSFLTTRKPEETLMVLRRLLVLQFSTAREMGVAAMEVEHPPQPSEVAQSHGDPLQEMRTAKAIQQFKESAETVMKLHKKSPFSSSQRSDIQNIFLDLQQCFNQ